MRTVKLWDYSRPIKQRHAGPCGPYYFETCDLPGTPGGDWKPDASEGFGAYLDEDERAIDEGSRARLRAVWADEIDGARIDHKGWFTDEDGTRETMRGCVLRLPRGRGFLAGWSMGGGMCASFSRAIYLREIDAARAADREAERAADDEREYQRKADEAQRLDDERDEANTDAQGNRLTGGGAHPETGEPRTPVDVRRFAAQTFPQFATEE